MKKTIGVAVLAGLFVSVMAQAEGPVKTRFEVGGEVFQHKYKEPGLMKEEGTLYGLVMNARMHGQWMWAGEIEIATGRVDYDGGTWGGEPLKISNINDWLVDGRILVGPEFNWNGGYGSPFVGLGYRWLFDKVASKYDYGYDRAANYFYLPVGGTATFALGDGWSLTPTAEYDFLLYGEQISELSDSDELLSDLTNKQTDGYGWRISVSIDKNFGSWGMKIQPFVRKWKIDDSHTSDILYAGVPYGYGWEPKNETTETGVQVLFTF